MVVGPPPILVVTGDKEVISDLSYSLKLINIPLISAQGLAEVKGRILSDRPCLVLITPNVGSGADSGILLARKLHSEPLHRDLPLVLLATPAESEALGVRVEIFREVLSLPVVFPAFTHQIQTIINKLILEGTSRTGRFGTKVAPDPVSAQSSTADPLGVVYKLQLEALKILERKKGWREGSSEQIAKDLLEATREACALRGEKDTEA